MPSERVLYNHTSQSHSCIDIILNHAMSFAKQLPTALKEIRLHLCQKGTSSEGLRSVYTPMFRRLNPSPRSEFWSFSLLHLKHVQRP
jgi:hypothetical protein